MATTYTLPTSIFSEWVHQGVGEWMDKHNPIEPKKRGRGRPTNSKDLYTRKSPKSDTAATTIQLWWRSSKSKTNIHTKTNIPTKKRGRGRPKGSKNTKTQTHKMVLTPKRGRGRPKGSKNQPKTHTAAMALMALAL